MSISFWNPRKIHWLTPTLIVLALLVTHLQTRARDQMRRDLLDLMQQQQQVANSLFDNFRNQYTPGFKAAHLMRAGVKFTQGEIFRTQTPTNLAINGQGCFVLRRNGITAYTRDGRFQFRDGLLCNEHGWAVQGLPLGDLHLDRDPCTGLYAGRYTGFYFDETGKCYGESTMTDPVTGVSTTTQTLLFQLALAQLQDPRAATETTGLSASQALLGRAGEGALGSICASSLELSNVDFYRQGVALKMFQNATRWRHNDVQPSQIQQDLQQRLSTDPALRRACFENLSGSLQPGYRATRILPWLCGQAPLQRSQSQGFLFETQSQTDVTMDGTGYFVVGDGSWTRTLNLDTQAVLAQPARGAGFATQAQMMRLPTEAANLEVSGDGVVRWTPLHGDGQPVTGFRLVLASTPEVAGDGIRLHPLTSPNWGTPARSDFGCTVQGYLEMSNDVGYERRIVGAALMQWAGLPLLAEPKERPQAIPVPPSGTLSSFFQGVHIDFLATSDSMKN